MELPPQISHDISDQLLMWFQHYYPGIQSFHLMNLRDFPIIDEAELLLHYLRGAAGPFVNTKVYTDIGVGWTLKAMDFESVEDGEAAETLVNEIFRKMRVHQSMTMFDVLSRVLGRSSIVQTENGDGTFYSNKKMGVTGFDCVNPMTFTYNSIYEVINDPTGKAVYKQTGSEERTFTQDRVIYHANNELSHRSVMGNSDLAKAITDLRTLARFPHYRDRIADNISNGFRAIKVDPVKLKAASDALAEKIFETAQGPQEYLDATSAFFTQQRKNGNDVAFFDWMDIVEQSWRGKEPDIQKPELDTIRSVGFKMEVPIELIGMGTDKVNRSTLETINDVYVAKSENGVRKQVLSPIIEDLAKKVLVQNDILEGWLKVEYNPFLSHNLLEMAKILSILWPTGAVSKPDIREKMNWDEDPDMGGDFWADKNPLPLESTMPNQTHINVAKMLENEGLVKKIN